MQRYAWVNVPYTWPQIYDVGSALGKSTKTVIVGKSHLLDLTLNFDLHFESHSWFIHAKITSKYSEIRSPGSFNFEYNISFNLKYSHVI